MVEERRKSIVGKIDEAYKYLEKCSVEKPASASRCNQYCSKLVQLRKRIVQYVSNRCWINVEFLFIFDVSTLYFSENEVDEHSLARAETLLATILQTREVNILES